MKELDFLKVINEISESEYLGDDCAYLKEQGIVVTQDNLAEDIHFKSEWCTPYQLGYKSVTVNISDILASGAKPAFVTIALSLPTEIDEKFIKEFYRGAKSALHGAKIIGGDITGADKIFISITAIGLTEGRRISSRKNAKAGYAVITRGKYGKSSAGLNELMTSGHNQELIKAHLEPQIDEDFSRMIAEKINADYAMMDTSDGLADALFKIAEASKVTVKAKNIEGMFCAEDYNLVAAVPKEFLTEISDYEIIGEVIPKSDCPLIVDGKKYFCYDDLGCYNHFRER